MNARIIGIKIRDYKRIEAVDIDVDAAGNVTVIGGENGNGKSSTLDAIEAALLGPQKKITKPIRDGATEARIIVKTDRFSVVRKFGKDGPSLLVTDEMGEKVNGAQQFLRDWIGDTFVDPLEFAGYQPIEQRQTVCSLADPPIDWEEYRRSKDEALGVQAAKLKEQERIEAENAGLPEYDDAPAEEVDVQSLSEELAQAIAKNSEVQTAKTRSQTCLEAAEACAAEIERLKGLIAEQEAKQAQALANKEQWDEAAKAAPIDTTGIQERIRSADETNKKVRANKAKQLARERWTAANDACAEATEEVKRVESEFKATLAKAKFPVPGLSVDEKGVLYNGQPLFQASQAEQIRVGMAVALAKAGHIKPVLVREGSLLDGKSLRLMAELAKEKGAQVFLEKVTDDEDPTSESRCTIVIEQGKSRQPKAQEVA